MQGFNISSVAHNTGKNDFRSPTIVGLQFFNTYLYMSFLMFVSRKSRIRLARLDKHSSKAWRTFVPGSLYK